MEKKQCRSSVRKHMFCYGASMNINILVKYLFKISLNHFMTLAYLLIYFLTFLVAFYSSVKNAQLIAFMQNLFLICFQRIDCSL